MIATIKDKKFYLLWPASVLEVIIHEKNLKAYQSLLTKKLLLMKGLVSSALVR